MTLRNQSTPGFLAVLSVISMIGAAVVSKKELLIIELTEYNHEKTQSLRLLKMRE